MRVYEKHFVLLFVLQQLIFSSQSDSLIIKGSAYRIDEQGLHQNQEGIDIYYDGTEYSGLSDSHGNFTISLGSREAHQTKLKLLLNSPGWRIIYPPDGLFAVPLGAREVKVTLRIDFSEMKGKSEDQKNSIYKKHLGLLLDSKEIESEQQFKKAEKSLSREIDELRKSGLSEFEAESRVRLASLYLEQSLSQEITNKAMLHLALKHLSSTSGVFDPDKRPQLWRENQFSSSLILELQSEGESRGQALELLNQSLECIQRLSARVNRDAYPWNWKMAQQRQAQLYCALAKLNEPQVAEPLWKEANDIYNRLLNDNTLEFSQEDLSKIHSEKGELLSNWASHLKGSIQSLRWFEAAELYRNGLKLMKMKVQREYYVEFLLGLCNALHHQFEGSNPSERLAMSQEIAGLAKQGLMAVSREEDAESWAEFQAYLGLSSFNFAVVSDGEEQSKWLAQCVQAFHRSIENIEKENPLYGESKLQLGFALQMETQTGLNQGSYTHLSESKKNFEDLLGSPIKGNHLLASKAKLGMALVLSKESELKKGSYSKQLADSAFMLFQSSNTTDNIPLFLFKQMGETQVQLAKSREKEERYILLMSAYKNLEKTVTYYAYLEKADECVKTHIRRAEIVIELLNLQTNAQTEKILLESLDSLEKASLYSKKAENRQLRTTIGFNLGQLWEFRSQFFSDQKKIDAISKSIESLTDAIQFTDDQIDLRMWIDTRLSLAKQLIQIERWKEAAKLYREVFERDPRDASLFSTIIFAQRQAGDLSKESLALHRSWINQHPEDYFSRQGLAERLWCHGQSEEALELLLDDSSQNPLSITLTAKALALRALAKASLKRWEEAQREVQSLLAMSDSLGMQNVFDWSDSWSEQMLPLPLQLDAKQKTWIQEFLSSIRAEQVEDRAIGLRSLIVPAGENRDINQESPLDLSAKEISTKN